MFKWLLSVPDQTDRDSKGTPRRFSSSGSVVPVVRLKTFTPLLGSNEFGFKWPLWGQGVVIMLQTTRFELSTVPKFESDLF